MNLSKTSPSSRIARQRGLTHRLRSARSFTTPAGRIKKPGRWFSRVSHQVAPVIGMAQKPLLPEGGLAGLVCGRCPSSLSAKTFSFSQEDCSTFLYLSARSSASLGFVDRSCAPPHRQEQDRASSLGLVPRRASVTYLCIQPRCGIRAGGRMQASGVHGTMPGRPVESSPAVRGWKPPTSLAGAMASITLRELICGGSGSCTRPTGTPMT